MYIIFIVFYIIESITPNRKIFIKLYDKILHEICDLQLYGYI